MSRSFVLKDWLLCSWPKCWRLASRRLASGHRVCLHHDPIFPAGESRETSSALAEDGPVSERHPGSACHAAGSRTGARREEH